MATSKHAASATSIQDTRDSQPALAEESRGWYLYGIVRREAPAEGSAGPGRQSARGAVGVALPTVDGQPVELLDCGDLAAVVRPVAQADFAPDALEARLSSAAALEAMARDHNEVIAAVHAQQPILPAKLGSVYACADDVTAAVTRARDALVAQLERIRGCDEWAVHVYADAPAIEERILADRPALRQLQQEIATASAGRAYFLKRKLADELADAAADTLRGAADVAYARLAGCARDGQASRTGRTTPRVEGATEILRAAFLVPRANDEAFLAAVASLSEEGLQCTQSGPWPPYSFAALAEPGVDEPRR